jgi:ketosteroid isomerase-like protein
MAALAKAQATCDLAELQKMRVPDHTIVAPNGAVVPGAELDQSCQPRKANEFREVKTRVYGNTAIAVGTIQMFGSQGQPLPLRRFTSVWIKQDGQWKHASFQATEIASPTPAAGTAEQQIRAQIQKIDAAANPYAGTDRQALLSESAITWSNRTQHPSGFYKDRQQALADSIGPADRKNSTLKTSPERIVIAKGGDMAYEYSTFTLSYDDARGHRQLEGALLRIWQNDGAAWKVAAVFQRPYGTVVPTSEASK